MKIFIFLTAFSFLPLFPLPIHLPTSFSLLFCFFCKIVFFDSLQNFYEILFLFIYFLSDFHAIKYLHFGFTRIFLPQQSQPLFENMLIDWVDEFMALIASIFSQVLFIFIYSHQTTYFLLFKF